MKIKYNLFFFLYIITVSSSICANERLTPIPNKPSAPDFLLMTVNESIRELSHYKGKPVIINFWASWCPPCRAELPSMNRAWKKVKNEGIEMIAINIGEDQETISAFTRSFPIDFTILLDESSEELRKWSIGGLPTTFVLDPQGRIVYKAVGEREWDNENLLDKVRALKLRPRGTAVRYNIGLTGY